MSFLRLPDFLNRKWSMSSGECSVTPSENRIEHRIIYGNKCDVFYGIIMEYFKKSSIHGLHYFAQQKRSFVERVFWLIFFLVSIVSCSYSVVSVFNRWMNFPIIISFDTTAMPVYEIPFPSIVVCPQFKSDTDIFNFTDVYNRAQSANASFEELDILSSMLHICSPPNVDKIIKILEKYEFNNTEIDEKLYSVMVQLEDTGIICVWYGIFYFCKDLQRYLTTDEGICYQFNGVDAVNLYRKKR